VSAPGDYRVIGGGLTILIIVAFGLWNEFHEAGQTAWNIFLALVVLGLIAVGFLGQRYFKAHAGEIGEARFDTRNEGQK
jgi:hypothetical protein